MRTRATGHSPSGFHVLASPKRVRRQPPPPVRASPITKNPSESNEEQSREISDETVSKIQQNPEMDSDNPDNRKNSQQNIDAIGIKLSETTTAQSFIKGAPTKSSAKFKQQIDQANDVKNNLISKRGGPSKNIKSNRGRSKKIQISENFAVKDVVTVEVDSAHRTRNRTNGSAQPDQLVLGKRNRSISPTSRISIKELNEVPRHKRARINGHDHYLSKSISPGSSTNFPHNYLEKPYPYPSRNQNLSSKNPPQLSNEFSNEDRSAESKSFHLTHREARPKTIKTPNSNIHHMRHLHSSKYSNVNFHNQQKSDVEAHLEQGMQSIMSRMNKYQYQPLPKNPYNCMTTSSSKYQFQKDLEINDIKLSPKFSISEIQNSMRYKAEAPSNDSMVDSNKTEIKHSFSNFQQSERYKHTQQGQHDKNKSEKLKERRMEVEKLFRTTAPNASYQNILRAVADWAVHDSSTLPTKDEIFSYVESSKAPDAAELFSTTDRSFSRSASISIKRSNQTSSSAINLSSSKNKTDFENNLRNSSRLRDLDNQSLHANRHVAFSKSVESQQSKSGCPLMSQDNGMPDPTTEIPSSSKASTSFSFANQSWGIVNTFKSLVSTPFKALGFGFGSSYNDSLHDVTKDMNFDFKPSVTPIASSRSMKKERKTPKIQMGQQTPVRHSVKKKPASLKFNYPSNSLSGDKSTTRCIVTEDRMAELQRELDLKKYQTREREMNNFITRQKTPTKNSKSNEYLVKRRNSSQPSQSHQTRTISENQWEEWPCNLDPDRPVVELGQASQNLPRGPNGEDMATMLCKGWLISKYRDSFIREAKNCKIAPGISRISRFKNSGVLSSNQDQESDTQDTTTDTEIEAEDKYLHQKQNENTQSGRIYGLLYDDDSSSDDGAIIPEKNSDTSSSANSSSKIVHALPRQALPDSGRSDNSDESSKEHEPIKSMERLVKKLSSSPKSTYAPRMPSTLRNVEALSTCSSNTTTSSTQLNQITSPQNNEDESLALFNLDNDLSKHSDYSEEWSFIFNIDPCLTNFNPDFIDSIESIPIDSLPNVQLPTLTEKLI